MHCELFKCSRCTAIVNIGTLSAARGNEGKCVKSLKYCKCVVGVCVYWGQVCGVQCV